MRFSPIRSKAAFKILYQAGKQYNSRNFKAFYLPQERVWEIGIVAGARVGGAVQRNRAKRLLRESLRSSLMNKKPKGRLAINAKKEILACREPEVREDIEIMFKKLIG